MSIFILHCKVCWRQGTLSRVLNANKKEEGDGVGHILKVGSLVSDGYHDVAIAYQAVSLYEEVRVYPADDFSVTVSGTVELACVPVDGASIAMRAAWLLAARTGYTGGARIEIGKHVPVTGRMGGVPPTRPPRCSRATRSGARRCRARTCWASPASSAPTSPSPSPAAPRSAPAVATS